MQTAARALLAAVVLSAAATAQITLPNGTTVPRERMVVFLFAGHSNMAGRCTPDDQTTHPRVWAYGASGHRYWEPCKDRIFTNSQGAGPATALLKLFADAYPQYYFCAIQNANSQAGVRWHNGDANNRYWKGAGRYEELLGYARDLQGKVTFGGVVTMLGIMEATSASSSYWSTFSDDVRTTVNNIRTDLGLTAAALPVLVQDYEREACSQFAASNTGPQAIITQISQVPGKVSRSAVIATNGIPCPDQCHHFDLAGMRTWAGRAYNTYRNNGWAFWATATDNTPPAAPSSVRIGTVTMTSLQVLWNACTDPSGIASYTVTWGTQSNTVSGTTTQLVVGNLDPCTNYSFTVKATDGLNNTSAASAPAAGKTGCCTDAVPPSVPSGLHAANVTRTSVALSWSAATDNQVVAGYEVYNGANLAGATTGATAVTYTVNGLSAATSYTFTVRAKDQCGNRSAPSVPLAVTTAERLVVALPFRVNLGGGATSGFAADKAWTDTSDYGHTGSSQTVTATTAVAGTDLDPVYQSLRYTECDGLPSSTLTFGYRIAVPNGHYVVTLMFAEFWRSSVGGRTFNVNLEGQPLPECPMDIYARAGSATALTIVSAVVITDGIVDIQTGMVVSDPLLCGVTVEAAPDVAPYTILSPVNGQQFAVGDTLRVRFEAQTGIVRDANVEISDDGGENWHSLMFGRSLSSSAPDWGDYRVTLPASIDGVPLGGKDWSLRVRDYDLVYIVQMAGTVHINPPTTAACAGEVRAGHRPLMAYAPCGRGIVLSAPAGERLSATVTTLGGAVAGRTELAPGTQARVSLDRCGCGMYMVVLRTGTRTVLRQRLLLR